MKSVLYSFGIILQASGLAASLYPALALFNPATDLRQMLYLAGFGGGMFFIGWLMSKAAQ